MTMVQAALPAKNPVNTSNNNRCLCKTAAAGPDSLSYPPFPKYPLLPSGQTALAWPGEVIGQAAVAPTP